MMVRSRLPIPVRIFRLDRLSLEQKRSLAGFLFVLPALFFFIIFLAYPVGNAIYVSFTDWDLFLDKKFIGVRNYVELSKDHLFWNSLAVTLYFAVGTAICIWILSLLMALLIDSQRTFSPFFRTIYFLPAIIPLAVNSVVWLYLFRRLGLVNIVLDSLFGFTLPWVRSSAWAMPAIIVVMVWTWAGYYMMIYLAGLKSIPPELHEAARIDGASWLQYTLRITLPLLKPMFLFVSILSVMNSLQAFAPFDLMTEGGPGDATRVLTFKIYQDAFFRFKMGRAAAQAMALFLIVMAFAGVQLRLWREGAVDGR